MNNNKIIDKEILDKISGGLNEKPSHGNKMITNPADLINGNKYYIEYVNCNDWFTGTFDSSFMTCSTSLQFTNNSSQTDLPSHARSRISVDFKEVKIYEIQ